MPGLTDLVDPKTLSWNSNCTVFTVFLVGTICAGAITGITYGTERREFHCYTSSVKHIRENSVEDYCYRKYSHKYNGAVPLAVYVPLFTDLAVPFVTAMYSRHVHSRVVDGNFRIRHKLKVFSAYMVQLVVRTVILVVFLCLQWSVFSAVEFPTDATCQITAQAYERGPQNKTTRVAKNASTLAPWRTYYCENPFAWKKSVLGWILFAIISAAFVSSFYEMVRLTYSLKSSQLRRNDEDFCKQYLNMKYDMQVSAGPASSSHSPEETGISLEERIPSSVSASPASSSCSSEVAGINLEERISSSAPPVSRTRKLNTSSGSASPTPSTPSHSPEETGINPKERRTSSALFKEIREEYQRRSKRLQVFPWCKTKQPLTDNIYTKLKILVRSNETGQLTSEIVNMNEIFKPHEECVSAKLVLIEGDPGMGKTTFCRKLSLDWSRKKIEAPFPQFQLVLLLMCRDLKTADIRKAITDQLLPRSVTKEEAEAFFRELQETQSDVLLILDGLDELKEHVAAEDLVDARKRNVLRNSYVLVTSRHNAEVRERCDTLLETVGFTKEDAEEYIRKYFKEEKAEDLLKKIDRSGPLKELLSNPLNTALICAVFEDNGDLPSARTQLYDKIVHCILKGFYSKQGKNLPKQRIDACKKELIEIGKCAFRGLIEGKLSFEESELESGSQTIASMGFLSKEESTDKVDPKSLLCFMHKTFQEYFAGLYVSDQIINEEKVTVEDLIQELSTEREKFAQMFIFIAGILAGKGAGANAQLVLFMKNLSYRLSTLYTVRTDVGTEQWSKQRNDFKSSLLLLCNCVAERSDGQQLNKLQKELCSIIGRNISWEKVSLSFSSISESSVVYIVLCEILKHNSTIKELNLSDNKISDCRLLAESLKQNSTLEWLYLWFNPISDKTPLEELKRHNEHLRLWYDE